MFLILGMSNNILIRFLWDQTTSSSYIAMEPVSFDCKTSDINKQFSSKLLKMMMIAQFRLLNNLKVNEQSQKVLNAGGNLIHS